MWKRNRNLKSNYVVVYGFTDNKIALQPRELYIFGYSGKIK